MSKNKRSRLKAVSLRTSELCQEIMAICSSPENDQSKVKQFESLERITSELCRLQKDICLVRMLSPDSRPHQLQQLLDHYRECVDAPISISYFDGTGFGIRSEGAIEKHSCILHIPLKHAFSVDRVTKPLPSFLKKDPLFSGMENVALSLAVLHEISLGDNSKWRSYFASLPSTYSNVPFFTSTGLRLLEGFPAADLVFNGYKNICRQYAYFYLLFHRMSREDMLPKYMQDFCFQDYRWAVSTVMSRNNELPLHGEGTKVLCLVPLWDMINHKFGSVTTDCDSDSGHMTFYAMESFPAGEEVLMDYGKRTSATFLLYSGFVPDVNPCHCMSIKLGLSKFDKLLAMRVQLLEKLGLKSEVFPVVSPKKGEFPSPEMLAFARIFVMQEDDVREALSEADDLAKSRLLSVTLRNNCVDAEAWKFIQGRMKLLIRGYELRLEKTMKLESLSSPLREDCLRLCQHDIDVLKICLENLG